jgi:ABC-2 type transport system ATP-binding protein
MLIKCIKHDLLATYREFTGLYTAMILLAIVGPFITRTNNQYLIAVLFFGIFGVIIATLVVTFLTIIRLYSRRLFSDEGYLTLTLPVKTSDTVISKVATGTIWSFATATVFIISGLLFSTIIFFVYAGSAWASQAKDIFAALGQIASTGIFNVFGRLSLLGIPMSLVDTVYSMILLIFVITLVNTSIIRKNRVAFGIVIYFALSLGLNAFMSLFHTTPFVFREVGLYFQNINSMSDFLLGLRQVGFSVSLPDYAFGIIGQGVIAAILGYATLWLLDHKLEME